MNTNFKKLLAVVLFFVCAAIPAATVYSVWGRDSLVDRLLALAMVTLIVFQAKWCFVDAFAAIDRKRIPGEAA